MKEWSKDEKMQKYIVVKHSRILASTSVGICTNFSRHVQLTVKNYLPYPCRLHAVAGSRGTAGAGRRTAGGSAGAAAPAFHLVVTDSRRRTRRSPRRRRRPQAGGAWASRSALPVSRGLGRRPTTLGLSLGRVLVLVLGELRGRLDASKPCY